MKYDILLCDPAKIAPFAGHRLAVEVAAFWNEHGELKQAKRWISLSKQYERPDRSSTDQLVLRRLANLGRREAQIALYAKPDDKSISARLERAADLLPSNELAFGITKLNLETIGSYLLKRDLAAMNELSENFFSLNSTVFADDGLRDGRRRIAGLSAATAAELYLFSGITLACLNPKGGIAESRIRAGLALMTQSGHRFPEYLWKLICSLPVPSNGDVADAIREIGSSHLRIGGIERGVVSQLWRLYDWLERAIPRGVQTVNHYTNKGRGTIIVQTGPGTQNIHVGSASEQLSALSASVESVKASSLLATEEALRLSDAQTQLQISWSDSQKNGTARRAAILLRDEAAKILSRIATNTAAAAVSEHLTPSLNRQMD